MGKQDNNNETSEKELPPLLGEFRTALQDEIEVAKRSASHSAIPLSNGHRVGQQAGSFQYAFQIDSVLNAPDGTPGDLVVTGKAPMGVKIVSTEGLRLVISVETDLGNFVPSASLQTNLTILMRKLIERIENNATSDNPAASRMLGTSPVSGIPTTPKGISKLHESQMRALESALGRNLTVIWGPPGTGKTYTIGTIAEHLHKLDRTILIVSHTNTAVDQAIKHVAKALQEHLEKGVVIRIGEVRDEVLKSDYRDVLLKTQVERQSLELVRQRDNFVNQKQELSNELIPIEEKISYIEWIQTANVKIESTAGQIEELQKQENEFISAKKSYEELEKLHPLLLQRHEQTAKILSLRKKLAVQLGEKLRIEELLHQKQTDYQNANNRIKLQGDRCKIAERIAPLREERRTYPSASRQQLIIENLSSEIVDKQQRLRNTQNSYSNAKTIFDQTNSVGAFMRVWKSLPKPESQEIIVSNLSKNVFALDADLMATQSAYKRAHEKLSRIIELDGELSQYKNVSTYSYELQLLSQAQIDLKQLETVNTNINISLKKICHEIDVMHLEEKQLSRYFEGDAKEVYMEVCSQLQLRKELPTYIKSIQSQIVSMRRIISSGFHLLLTQLYEWKLIKYMPSEIAEIIELLTEVIKTLLTNHSISDLPFLKQKMNSIGSEIQHISEEIALIDVQLAQVERKVIQNASVVGATLTKTYLSDDIQDRKFDTVILDEASMAPIPALWVASLLADKNLIITGDYKQLPPIVLSNNALTQKWLGRDIFEVSELKDMNESGNPPDHFIQLLEQSRMLPDIMKVANLFYDGKLRNAPERPSESATFLDWYNTDWTNDNQVVLVDTSSLNAWVTSVVKGSNSSRLNFLSATVAVDLAEQLLRSNRSEREEGDANRIIIASPYSAHSKLVRVLIDENHQLKNEVTAGTVHSFQGSEADVVIFDLVADEPHWRVNLFMPDLDEQIKRLLNVGVTRAKYRLFILGNFTYCQNRGKKAFLGKTLLPFLLRSFPKVDASQLFPDGLAARAANAQMTMMGGEIEPNSARIVVTQANFFQILSSDISRAKKRIIIYSPFIAQNRLSFLLPQLQAATQRGVSVQVISKSHSERSKSEILQIKGMERQLSEIDVNVMHKMRMHEKLVFVDDDIIWSGSLNPMSFSNTQEIMERRKSKAVFEDYFKILRIEELLGIQGSPESRCPICGSEMIAAEGADQPYYWRCVNNNCYTRSIDQSYPLNGILSCNNCDSPVEFGYWGDNPSWRCTENNRHHMKIFKSHLRLPKMAALIPKGEQRKVCMLLGIDDLHEQLPLFKSHIY